MDALGNAVRWANSCLSPVPKSSVRLAYFISWTDYDKWIKICKRKPVNCNQSHHSNAGWSYFQKNFWKTTFVTSQLWWWYSVFATSWKVLTFVEKVKQIIPIEFPEAHKHWSLIGWFSAASCAKKRVECGFGLAPGFQWLCRHVPRLPPSPCSLGSCSKQPGDQL